MNTHECVLLLGAGFTRNFGAPLAADLWALLFSHPDLRRHAPIHDLLRSQFDFETVYHEVMTGNFQLAERRAMEKAIQDTYDYVDSIVQGVGRNIHAPDIYRVQAFLNAFAGIRGRPGFIFSLNQDLFIERYFCNGTRPVLPHIPSGRDWFTSDGAYAAYLGMQALISDALSPSLASIGPDSLYYVKLHGSSNWFSTAGTRQMVIGRAKEAQIGGDSLLSFYADLFRKVLVEGTRRVLCLGYSFRDDHINNVLADSVDSGVEIFILGPGSPQSKVENLKKLHRGADIWKGLAGYFPFDLHTLFPPDNRSTQEWRFVSQQIFGRVVEP